MRRHPALARRPPASSSRLRPAASAGGRPYGHRHGRRRRAAAPLHAAPGARGPHTSRIRRAPARATGGPRPSSRAPPPPPAAGREPAGPSGWAAGGPGPACPRTKPAEGIPGASGLPLRGPASAHARVGAEAIPGAGGGAAEGGGCGCAAGAGGPGGARGYGGSCSRGRLPPSAGRLRRRRLGPTGPGPWSFRRCAAGASPLGALPCPQH